LPLFFNPVFFSTDTFAENNFMPQERYNIFNQIHKGLRGLLYDTALAIQQTDMSSDAGAEVLARITTVIEVFEAHAHSEDKYLLPMIQKHDAAIVLDFEKDHDMDHQFSETLADLIGAWYKAATKSDRQKIGLSIFYAFNEFVAFNLYHMNREESTLLLAIWKHYTDEELHEVTGQIVANIPHDILMTESLWMMRSLNDPEIAGWLTEIRMGAPTEVFMKYLEMAKNELPEHRRVAIHEQLEFTPANA